HFTCAPSPIIRGCMTLFANPTDELSTLFETVLMIASELFTLNTSKVGSTVNRFTLNDFETLKSSWVMRSVNVLAVGTRFSVNVAGWNVAGRITEPATPA